MNALTTFILAVTLVVLTSCSKPQRPAIVGRWHEVGMTGLVAFHEDGMVELTADGKEASGKHGFITDSKLKIDVNTLRALEDALDQFAGCVVVISHDRWFLDRIATHILAFEGESKVTFFDGNFSEYEDWRRQTLGDAATRPHRITLRKLTR